MGLEEIATFVEAVDQGSLAGAGRVLGLPKSTVSRRLSRLEQELGQELVQRHSRLFHVTEAGQALYRQSVAAVRDLQGAARFVRDGATAIRGQLRITLPLDLGTAPGFIRMIADFRQAHPEVDLTFVLTDRRVDLVGEGFDFALRAGSRPLDDTMTLMVRRIATVEVGLFASPTYLDQRGRPRSPADLADHCCVSMRTTPGADTWQLTRGEEQVEVAIQPALRASSMTFLPAAACEHLGITPTPVGNVADLVRTGRLERVLPRWSLPSASLSLLWPASRLPSPRRQAFREFVVERLSAQALMRP